MRLRRSQGRGRLFLHLEWRAIVRRKLPRLAGREGVASDVVLETAPWFYQEKPPLDGAFFIIESICVCIFTVEFGARLGVCMASRTP